MHLNNLKFSFILRQRRSFKNDFIHKELVVSFVVMRIFP